MTKARNVADLGSNDVIETTATGVSVTGEVVSDGLSLGDNDKATFGAGDDLQIYHSGSHSFISDAGTGQLFIDATNLRLRDASANLYLLANSGGEVGLYYNNSEKLATTSTGVDVTGTVTADGLTVDGDVTGVIASIENDSTVAGTGGLKVNTADTSSSTLPFYVRSANVNRFMVRGNGDVHWYEDTGTTAKMTWDASAEKLLVDGVVELDGSNPYGLIRLARNSDSSRAIGLRGLLSDDSTNGAYLYYSGGAGSGLELASTFMSATVAGSERMRIDSSGNVGIGTDSPDSNSTLHVKGSSNYDGKIIADNSSDTGGGTFTVNQNGTTRGFFSTSGSALGDTSSDLALFSYNGLRFFTGNSTEKARIDSSGNLLVGTTSDYGTAGTGVFNGGVASQGTRAVTETICEGASGAFSGVEITFTGNAASSTGIMDVQVAAYNNKALDYCIMQYSTHGLQQLRTNTSGLTVSVSGTPSSTGDVWKMTVTGSMTHPVVTAKCTVGGLANSFSSAPTITFF